MNGKSRAKTQKPEVSKLEICGACLKFLIEKKVSSGYVVKVQGESNEATHVMRYNVNKMTEEDEDDSENQSVSNFESEKFSSDVDENSRPRKIFIDFL